MKYLSRIWKRLNNPIYSSVEVFIFISISLFASILSEPLYRAINTVWADVDAVIVDVKQDDRTGSVIIITEYKIDGRKAVSPYADGNWRTRYDENSGTVAEIVQKARQDLKDFGEALIQRIDSNKTASDSMRLERNKELTQPFIDQLKIDAIGQSVTVTNSIIQHKGKEIEITTNNDPVFRDIP